MAELYAMKEKLLLAGIVVCPTLEELAKMSGEGRNIVELPLRYASGKEKGYVRFTAHLEPVGGYDWGAPFTALDHGAHLDPADAAIVGICHDERALVIARDAERAAERGHGAEAVGEGRVSAPRDCGHDAGLLLIDPGIPVGHRGGLLRAERRSGRLRVGPELLAPPGETNDPFQSRYGLCS